MGHLAAETITGSGHVTQGSRGPGRVNYFIEITPDIPDHPITTGTLCGDPAMLMSLYREFRVATLHLDDGRCWDFVVSTPRGDVINAARGRGLFWPGISRTATRDRPRFTDVPR
jgi:hypothetical protein